MRGSVARIISLLLLGLALAGCWPTGKTWEPGDKKKVFGATHQQLAPEPVYNRLRWVQLPSVMPPENIEASSEKYFPVVHLELKSARLDEAAKTLASLSRYHSYCAATIADRRISINALGTMDELAARIADQEKIEVVVDNDGKEVRFLARNVQPAFSNNEVSGHESKQTY